MHVIEQFNGGLYETIIASDEKFIEQTQNKEEQKPIKQAKRFARSLS